MKKNIHSFIWSEQASKTLCHDWANISGYAITFYTLYILVYNRCYIMCMLNCFKWDYTSFLTRLHLFISVCAFYFICKWQLIWPFCIKILNLFCPSLRLHVYTTFFCLPVSNYNFVHFVFYLTTRLSWYVRVSYTSYFDVTMFI